MADDFYAKIAAAAASGGGNFIVDGSYKFIIEKCFRKDGHEGTSFIAELRVVESTVHPNYPDVKPNAVGSTCSMVCNVTKHASALGNAKAFVTAALGAFGYTEDEITPEIVARAFTTDDLRGVFIEDTTYRKAIKGGKNQGNMITLNKWTPVPQTEAEVASQKDALAAGKYSVKPAATPKTETPVQAATTTAPAGGSLLRRP